MLCDDFVGALAIEEACRRAGKAHDGDAGFGDGRCQNWCCVDHLLELFGNLSVGIDVSAGKMDADIRRGERDVVILGDHVDRGNDESQAIVFFGHRKTGQSESGRFPILVKRFRC